MVPTWSPFTPFVNPLLPSLSRLLPCEMSCAVVPSPPLLVSKLPKTPELLATRVFLRVVVTPPLLPSASVRIPAPVMSQVLLVTVQLVIVEAVTPLPDRITTPPVLLSAWLPLMVQLVRLATVLAPAKGLETNRPPPVLLAVLPLKVQFVAFKAWPEKLSPPPLNA